MLDVMHEMFGDMGVGEREDIDPAHAHLAAAVISAAVRDCCTGTLIRSGVFRYVDDGRKEGKVADTARAFLSRPNDGLAFWCARLRIDPMYIVRCYWTKLYVRQRKTVAA